MGELFVGEQAGVERLAQRSFVSFSSCFLCEEQREFLSTVAEGLLPAGKDAKVEGGVSGPFGGVEVGPPASGEREGAAGAREGEGGGAVHAGGEP